MSVRRKAVKGLLILACVLAVCMFFARTLQTITTAKVEKVKATRGKMEDKIALEGKVHFEKGEDVVIPEAAGLGVSIKGVKAREGYFVKKGDVLAEMISGEYASKMETLKAEHAKAAREWAEESAKTIRLPQSSLHNEIYNRMIRATDQYFAKRYEAVALAARLGYELPGDTAQWGKTPERLMSRVKKTPKLTADPVSPEMTPEPEVKTIDMPDEKTYPGLAKAITDAHAAYVAHLEASLTLYNLYMGVGGTRVGDATFQSIVKRDGHMEEMAKAEKKMMELENKKLKLESVAAPHDGYLTSFSLKVGDGYDGVKPLFVMTSEKDTPSLRADVTEVKKSLRKGMKVKVEGLARETAIDDIVIEADNRKYAVVKLNDKQISEMGGLGALMKKTIPITITYKADRTTTLLPAGAVRTAQDGSSYVFAIEESCGGMLGNAQMKVVKLAVTVLERSDKLVSVSDDLSYRVIADHEDRTIVEGQQVMEYVD